VNPTEFGFYFQRLCVHLYLISHSAKNIVLIF